MPFVRCDTMLYKFKSKATADLIMLQANGFQLLQLIGKGGDPDNSLKGIILPEQMPQAIAALEAAVAHEEAARQAASAQALAQGEGAPRAAEVSLRQRATPFLDMLRRCQKADKEIVWGV